MKGPFRIGGALVVGILMVLGALYVQNGKTTTEAGSLAVVTDAPERSAIKTTDADGDGIADWEESLHNKVLKTIETPTSTPTLGTEEEYIAPTTFTGKFSEAFFEDYLKGKINGEDFSDPTAFVGTAIEAIDKNTTSRRYTRAEIVIVPDSPEAIRTYGNDITGIMKKYSLNNENEAVILQKALSANDPQLLEALIPIYGVYKNTINDSRSVLVPESLVYAHINLLNAYEAILTDIGAMQVAFTDPLYSLARVKGYQDDAQALFNSFQNINRTITGKGITYTSAESGALLYMFDI